MAQGNHWINTAWAKLKRIAHAVGGLFAGRISRTTFALCAGLYAAIVWLLFLPVTTFLWTSPKTLVDAYMVFFFAMFLVLMAGFVRQYVRRLHDVSLHGIWAIIPLIAIPAGVLYLGYEYAARRSAADFTDNTSDVVSIAGWLAIGLPLLIALKRGTPEANRYGPLPPSVEHLWGAPFNRFVIFAGGVVLLSASIFAGFGQDGIWVGRQDRWAEMPMIDSSPAGRVFMKCWNVKGVAAGTGEGRLRGFHRDGFSDVTFDFSALPDGALDITTAGKTVAMSYRRESFRILSYGIRRMPDDPQLISIRENPHFMISAIYDDETAPGVINYTTFSFERGDSGFDFQMVMSTNISGARGASLAKFPAARGKMMIGDCMAM